MKKIIKDNIKLIIGFIIGGVVFGTIGVYAATILAANQVGYDNTSSGVSATNVQGALDELYTRASKWLNPNDMGTPQYYAFGKYKAWWCNSSNTVCNSLADFPTTATTPPSGKNVYLGLYADNQYGVCIQRNGKEHCFRGSNYKAEEKHIQEVFSDISCNVDSNGDVNCNASDFNCFVGADGIAYCYDTGAHEECGVNTEGSFFCS